VPEQRALAETVRLPEEHRDEVRPVIVGHAFVSFASLCRTGRACCCGHGPTAL
jgi:hypothetical protein